MSSEVKKNKIIQELENKYFIRYQNLKKKNDLVILEKKLHFRITNFVSWFRFVCPSGYWCVSISKVKSKIIITTYHGIKKYRTEVSLKQLSTADKAFNWFVQKIFDEK